MKKSPQLLLFLFACVISVGVLFSFRTSQVKVAAKRPNILFAIADDQSYPHAGAYGSKLFQTPTFDAIAQQGVLFTNAFVAAPQCSPSRAALLTGRNIWQLEEAGTHSSYFPNKYPVFTDALEMVGYFRGYTGKPWGPGNWEDSGWKQNPVGPEYNQKKHKVPYTGINKTDYVGNFKTFMEARPSEKPFFFWFGAQEPHRVYEYGSGTMNGLTKKDIILPPFLPDTDSIRQDFLDYALEIAWFDQQLAKMVQILKDAGEWENTIVVVTADNGMPFPYAKANLQEYGTHVPLAICGPGIKGNRVSDDLVSLIDLAPTFMEFGQTTPFSAMSAKSLMPILNSLKSGLIDPDRKIVLTGRERHTHARPDNLGYPARAIRTADYLFIQNFKPDRWPLGDPPPANPAAIAENGKDLKAIVFGYEDIDDSPSKEVMIHGRTQWPDLFQIGFQKRPAQELYDIRKDPGCLHNLAGQKQYTTVRKKMAEMLSQQLVAQGDPRTGKNGDVFDSYPRFGKMRSFDGFKEREAYNPAYQK
jgi:uncharacterized sulfatase